MKKREKWLTQIFLVSFWFWLGILTSAILPIGGPSMGDFAVRSLIFVPLACTVGVVFGDKIFYRDRKPSILAVITAPVFGIMGMYLRLFLDDLIYPLSTSIIAYILPIIVATIPLIIAYNSVSYLSRKKFASYKKIIAELFFSICFTYESMFFTYLLSGTVDNASSFMVKIICISLGATIGIALTDRCLGEGYKLNILAIFITLFLSVLGTSYGLMLFDQPESLISIILFLLMVTIPPLIGYNAVILWMKKDSSNIKETGK